MWRPEGHINPYDTPTWSSAVMANIYNEGFDACLQWFMDNLECDEGFLNILESEDD